MADEVISRMRSSFSMTRQRCYNPNNSDYPYYGGRGITICQRWLDSFENFLADMGRRPDGYTLERSDNDGPYSPDNCRWASRAEQSVNTRSTKRVTYNGETHSVAEWERIMSWKPGTLKARLGALGYSVDEAFTKEVKCGGLLPGRIYTPRRSPTYPNGLPKSRCFRDQPDLDLITFMSRNGKTFSHIARWFGVAVTTASNAVQRKGPYRDYPT